MYSKFTLLAICLKSQKPSFWEVMDSVLLACASLAASRTLLQPLPTCLNFNLYLEYLFCQYKRKKWFLWTMTEQAAENEVLGKQSTLLVENLFFFLFFVLAVSSHFVFVHSMLFYQTTYLDLCAFSTYFFFFFFNWCTYIFSACLKFIIKWRKTFEFR